MTTFTEAMVAGSQTALRVYKQRRTVRAAAAVSRAGGFAQRMAQGLLTLAGLGAITVAAWTLAEAAGWAVGGVCALILAQTLKSPE